MIKLGLALRVTMTIRVAKIATVVVTILVAKIAIAVAITLAVKIAIAVVIILAVKIVIAVAIILIVKIATVVTVQTRMTKVLDQIQVIQTLPLSLIPERWCKHWKLTSLGKVKF